MRSRIWRIFTVVMVASLLLPLVAIAAPVDPNTDALLTTARADGAKRFIVQLDGDPLAWHFQKAGAPAAMSRDGGRLDVNAPASQAYMQILRRQQAEAIFALQRSIPGARVAQYKDELGRLHDLTYRVVLNGFVVQLPEVNRENLIKLSRLPGVKAVTVERRVELNMEVINPTIGAPAVWAQLGGVDVAGDGIKVAVIDTGVDPNHPGLDPTGYSYPVGFPKGDTRYTTPKVIAIRGFYRNDDPPVDPFPLPAHPHGTGVATIIGTNPDTVATYQGVDVTISGVAPKAYILAYQVFYPSASGSAGRWASNAEVAKAIEQMVADGADVVNNSWGESVFIPLKAGFYPTTDALDAAAAAGVVVVKSAGNSGRSGLATVGGNDQPVGGISVGATANTRAFGNEANVVAPQPVPAELQSMLAVPAAFGGELTQDLPPTVYVDVGRVHQGNVTACDAIEDPGGELQGKVALISRGKCRFDQKVKNAQDAGAILAIIYNNVTDAPPINMGGKTGDITIPAFMVGNPQGLAMVAFENDHPGQAQLTIGAQTAYITDIAPEDILTDFSSRGPGFPLNRIIPDVVAQGENVLSGYGITSGPGGLWAPWAGTSASGPVVAGAAALLKQVHPDWAPWMIKSALMTTAKSEVWVDYAKTTLGQPMEIGAGRIRVDKATDPGAVVRVIDPTGQIPTNQSAMFGLMSAGESKTLTLEFTSVIGADATWNISVSDPFTVGLGLSSATVDVAAGATGTVDLVLNVPQDMSPGDYYGSIEFSHGSHQGHIPFWVRVEAPPGDAQVLLIDDDGSFLQPIFFGLDTTDYRPYYESLMQDLGYTYDVWDAEAAWLSGPGLPDIATLQQYDKIVWFTGDSFLTYFGITASGGDRVRFLDFFHNTPDRKLVITGQDWSGYHIDFQNGTDSGCVLCNMGVADFAEDAYKPAGKGSSPLPAAVGEGPFADMVVDLGAVVTPTIESGAGNQSAVDGLFPDGVSSPEWTGIGLFRTLMTADGASTESVPYVATGRGAEPKLEWLQAGDPMATTTSTSRAIYFTFGLEGINNEYADALGYATRQDVMKRAFEWLQDKVSISVDGITEVDRPAVPVVLTATLTSSLPYTQPVSFRWDWGDGSGIVSGGSSPTAAHTYADPGTYTVWVEGTDPMGHSALTSIAVTVNPDPVQPVELVTETAQFIATADTYIDAWAVPWLPPTVGDDPAVHVRGKDIRTALLTFDLSSVPNNAQVTSATLKVYATSGVGTVTVGAYNLMRDWSENDATWWEAMVGEKWASPGANGDTDRDQVALDTKAVGSGGFVTFDVTAAAQALLDGTGYGIALRGDDAANGGEWLFVSREFNNADLLPVLEVTYSYPSGNP